VDANLDDSFVGLTAQALLDDRMRFVTGGHKQRRE
jgi:hypothetical protein